MASSRPESGAQGPAAPPWNRILADGPLRLHMLEFQADIGLLPGQSAEARAPRNRRGKARAIYDERVATPKGLLACFPEEVAAAQRLGRPVNRAFTLELPPYQVYCVAYYHYDGLCAMLYVEQKGEFLAAWCEREMENALAPRPVLVNGAEAEFQAFLRHAMLTAQGGA